MQEEQRRLFGQYISYHQEYGGDIGEPLQMALVLGGEKPATTFDPPTEMFSQYPNYSPRTLVKEWGLYCRRTSTDPALMVSPSSLWFDLLPTVEMDTNRCTRRFGLFFGYPFDDINFFLRAEGAILPAQKYVEQGVFSAEEVAYTVFAFYRPEDSETGYKRAISIGKRHYDQVHRLSRKWGLPGLVEIADRLHSDFTARYSDDVVSAYSLVNE